MGPVVLKADPETCVHSWDTTRDGVRCADCKTKRDDEQICVLCGGPGTLWDQRTGDSQECKYCDGRGTRRK